MFDSIKVKYYQYILDKLMTQTPGFQVGETTYSSVGGLPVKKYEARSKNPWLLIYEFVTKGPINNRYIARRTPYLSKQIDGYYTLGFRAIEIKDNKQLLKLQTSSEWVKTTQ